MFLLFDLCIVYNCVKIVLSFFLNFGCLGLDFIQKLWFVIFPLQVFEGKPYYLDIVGNFKPVAASGQELVITFHSFRVNRLSFVAHIVDAAQPPTAQLFLNKELVTPSGKRAEPPIFTLAASLPSFDAGLVSPDLEPDQWKAKLEAAKLSLGRIIFSSSLSIV